MTSQLTGVWGGTPNDIITFTTPAGRALTGVVFIAGDTWLAVRVSHPSVTTLINRSQITLCSDSPGSGDGIPNAETPDRCRAP